MAKRRLKKVPKVAKKVDLAAKLRSALAKRPKDELVELVVDIAREDSKLFRRLDAMMELDSSLEELVEATRLAISDATDFDERQVNDNFDYDFQAYGEVKRNFGRLIKLGHLRRAMELSLELMKQGSYQVEMSDEGLMSSDIEECLQVVINALRKCDLPVGEVVDWCKAMLQSDCVGFICDGELRSLQERAESARRK
ncbi:MAG: hypothetical protein KJZ87_08735 [Thermoguttaceae bacterium]|nr:hypothetical protein [Thermoguttaceae bacterium]